MLVRTRMALSELTIATASTTTVVERCRPDDELWPVTGLRNDTQVAPSVPQRLVSRVVGRFGGMPATIARHRCGAPRAELVHQAAALAPRGFSYWTRRQ